MIIMQNKITFFVLNATGSAIKRITLSRGSLCFSGVFFTVSLIFFAFFIYDYCNLKNTYINTHEFESKISSQLDEIVNQRKQIQNFAGEINKLKSKLVDLAGFEKKIRIIANIEEISDQESFFGIGGSIPEDINAQLPLAKKHNSLIREMHEQVEQLELASTNQKNEFEYLFKHLEDQRNLLSSTPAILPTDGWISSKFGHRKSPFTGLRELHRGLDIATRKGTPIIATADGVVTYAGKKGLMGNLIVIDHGHGMVTRYAHIHKFLKKRGDVVKRGDTIALVGNTGRSTGPHVHYEVHLNGIPVNPERYILN